MVRGWVYIITNESMPDLVKIGYSKKDPILRAKELNNTGVPHEYRVAYDALVINPRECEVIVHNKYSYRREAKEWFKSSVSEAVSIIQETLSEIILLEKMHVDIEITNENETHADIEITNENETNADIEITSEEEMQKNNIELCTFIGCDDDANKEFKGKRYCIWHFRELVHPSKKESIRLLREEFKSSQRKI